MHVEERLREMGIVLPSAWQDAPNRVRCVTVDKLVYVGGHGPFDALSEGVRSPSDRVSEAPSPARAEPVEP